jgi:Raf kinase inhibitor-like YbhB/YbcL family protein
MVSTIDREKILHFVRRTGAQPALNCRASVSAGTDDMQRTSLLIFRMGGRPATRSVCRCSWWRRLTLASAAGLILISPAAPAQTEAKLTTTISSSAFGHNGPIPKKYTCDGKDVSPPLTWRGVPPSAKSLVLIVDDPDAPDPAAPKMTWVHWVLYNLPATATGLAEAIAANDLPRGTHEGLNDWKRTGYGGPCPPIGRHRYFHKLYALDVVLPDLGKPTKHQLEQAMKGHVVGQAELVGTYQR